MIIYTSVWAGQKCLGQLAFCPTYFHGEALVWKTIIQLNLIG